MKNVTRSTLIFYVAALMLAYFTTGLSLQSHLYTLLLAFLHALSAIVSQRNRKPLAKYSIHTLIFLGCQILTFIALASDGFNTLKVDGSYVFRDNAITSWGMWYFFRIMALNTTISLFSIILAHKLFAPYRKVNDG